MSKNKKELIVIEESAIDEVIAKISTQLNSINYYKYGYNFSGIDYDSINGRSCGGNCDDYMCHHGTIESTQITSVNLNELINDILCPYENNSQIYCIDRILRLSDMKETSSWKVLITSGYYGQETNGVELKSDILSKVLEELTNLKKCSSDTDKIKYCLLAEYGSVLQSLKALSNVKILEVDLDKIELFNDNYQRKLNKKYVDQYNNFALPRALCVESGPKYKVIDGYHRMTAAINSNLKTVKILVLE